MSKDCKLSTQQSPTKCKNRTVVVTAKKGKFQDIKQHFMLFSSLAFEVIDISNSAEETTVAISFWGDGPNSFLLGDRVKSALENKTSEFGIESIRADFLPKLTCK